LVQQDKLRGFALAGGTGPALHLGHRISIDLDFFTRNSFTVVKSLVFFADAENDPDPMSLEDVSWGNIKEKLTKMVAAIR
jgi:hypothetical protein